MLSAESIQLDKLEDIPETKEGLYGLWEIVLYAPFEHQFVDAWNLLLRRFERSQPTVVRYLLQKYVSVKEEWAACYINRNRNFGVRTTSPTETTHKALKSYILDGNADLLKLQLALEELLELQAEDHELQLSNDILKIRNDWIGRAYLGNLPGQITRKALLLINEQFKLASSLLATKSRPRPTQIDKCHCIKEGIKAYHGLYCYHDIYERIKITEDNPRITPLTLDEVDQFWHTRKSLVSVEPDLAILDPPLAVQGGRPATGTAVTLSQAVQKEKGRRVGGRASRRGGGLAPSQRRNRSDWEDPGSNRVHNTRSKRRRVDTAGVAQQVTTQEAAASSPPTQDCIVAQGDEPIPEPRTELRILPRRRRGLVLLNEG
ncbi:hypothetical protein F5B19DRAFT_441951 [Rostrohypoxylon terebratum]|nr:hypothetical protein F5B19DRAFT_441951 [Rostrohypoxylon terebratum]